MGGGRRRLHPVRHDRAAELETYHVRLVQTGPARIVTPPTGSTRTPTATTPAAANFLFCDGSVHFIKSSIAIKTYWCWGPRPTARSSRPIATDPVAAPASARWPLHHGVRGAGADPAVQLVEPGPPGGRRTAVLLQTIGVGGAATGLEYGGRKSLTCPDILNWLPCSASPSV